MNVSDVLQRHAAWCACNRYGEWESHDAHIEQQSREILAVVHPRIETAEQLDALPIGAVVTYPLSREPRTEYRKFGPYVWGRFGDSRMYDAPTIYRHTPLHLIWHPDWADQFRNSPK